MRLWIQSSGEMARVLTSVFCRARLSNLRVARLWQLLPAIGYVAILSYGQLVIRPDALSPGVLIGALNFQ